MGGSCPGLSIPTDEYAGVVGSAARKSPGQFFFQERFAVKRARAMHWGHCPVFLQRVHLSALVVSLMGYSERRVGRRDCLPGLARVRTSRRFANRTASVRAAPSKVRAGKEAIVAGI